MLDSGVALVGGLALAKKPRHKGATATAVPSRSERAKIAHYFRNCSPTKKKGRGRPKVGAVLIGVRVPPTELAEIDRWVTERGKPKPSRPEAIRQLVELGLKARSRR